MATLRNATARRKKPVSQQKTLSAADIRANYDAMYEKMHGLETGSYGYCTRCGRILRSANFYRNSDPDTKAKNCAWCKDCCRDVALRKDKNGDLHTATSDSVKRVLEYIDKPFIETEWVDAVKETKDSEEAGIHTTAWDVYIRKIQLVKYVGKRWCDSDMFVKHFKYDDEKTDQEIVEEGHASEDSYDTYKQNKEDVIRLLDFDPFEKEPLADQPFLYSYLLGMLDSSEDANDDMMRTSSAISIVRGFLQLSKIDDVLARLMTDIENVSENAGAIKSLQDSKQKITSMITSLAAESCLSLKNSKTSTKGDNTWTGKVRKIKELNLREGEVNGFDMNTCRGMQQVMDMSNASILKQLHLDESEYSDMLAEQRELVTKYRKDLDSYKEISRILLREDIDLRDFIAEKGVDKSHDLKLVDLNDLYSPFKAEAEADG